MHLDFVIPMNRAGGEAEPIEQPGVRQQIHEFSVPSFNGGEQFPPIGHAPVKAFEVRTARD